MARSKGSNSRSKRRKSTKPDVPSEHDWRTTDAQEIDRRRQRARDEKMRIENLTPAQNVFSNFRVHSASGRDYQVEIRGLDPLECACECVDFLSNGLATKRSIAESVLDRSTDVTSILLRKSSKDAAERLRQLTGQSPTSGDPAAPAKPPEPPKPRDVTQEFAARLRQRLGTQLVACEERAPVGGGPVQILVVSEHVAHARAPWMDSLRDEFFPSLDGNPPSHQIDILDRATFDAIERLVKAGLLQRTDTARRDLLDVAATPSGPVPLTPEEESRLREATARTERCLRRAQVLGNADFPEDAIASLRDSLLPMAIARAVRERWPVPATHADLLAAPWPSRWSNAYPTVQQLLKSTAADTLPDWHPSHSVLVGWMG